MMSSSWKISVFGIVALMLAFGLAMTDAKAATDPSPVTVVVGGADALRATGDVTLTFTISLEEVTDADPPGTVTISTPRGSGWSSPRFMTSRAAAAEGDAVTTANGDVTYQISASTDLISVDVANYQLIATVKPGADENATITWRFKTALPNVAKDYSFGISSNVHKGTLTTLDPGTRTVEGESINFTGGAIDGTINEQRTFDGRGRYIVIDVGPVADGTGKIELTSPSFTKGADDYKNAGPETYNYAGQYLITKDQALGNLVFRYTAAGTMYKGSVVQLALPSDTALNSGARDGVPTWEGVADRVNELRVDNSDGVADAGEVTVSGAKITALTESSVTATTTGTIQAGSPIVFTIRGAKAPTVIAAVANKYTFAARSGSAVTPDAAPTVLNLLANGTVTFTVTNPHGTGKVESDLTNVNSGVGAANMTLTFTAAGVMLEGSVVKISVPAAWSPSPFKRTVAGGVDRPGEITLTGTDHSYEVANRVITVTLGIALSDTNPIVLNYALANPPDAENEYEFSSMANSHKQGPLGAIASPKINVIVGDGSGTIELARSNGQRLERADKDEPIGTVRFKYTPAGRMASGSVVQITIPSGWTPPIPDNRDGTHDAGEVKLNGSADLVIVVVTPSTGPWTLTATTNAVITASDSLTIDYRNIKAPAVDSGSYEFTTRVVSPGDGELTDRAALLVPSPTVGINQSPDGSGTIAWNLEGSVVAGANVGNIVFIYTAGAGEMKIGSQVEIKIDAGWPDAVYDNGDGTDEEGETTVSGSGSPTLDIVGSDTLVATTSSTVASGETIAFTYKNITAPTRGGPYSFSARSKVTSDGNLTSLQQSLSVNVDEIAAGTVTLMSMGELLTSAAPGMDLGDLVFTFTVGAAMESGAQVSITIPVGWTPAFLDNNDGSVSAGEVSLSGPGNLGVSGGGSEPWVLTATTTGLTAAGDLLTFTYKGVTAPAAQDSYTFTTKASLAPGDVLLAIEDSGQPRVVVRAPVDAIAIMADPTSVFTGGEVSLSVTLSAGAGAGKALGNVVVTLDDGDAEGTFSPASITIADNTGEGTATYTNSAAGDVTITATSGEMTDSVDVEIKSTIRDLTVDLPLVKQGSTIMVRAIGQAGSGTVTILDEDGDKVGTKKALDPIGDVDPDGDQEYSRSVELPAVLPDGTYTLSVEIQGDVNNSLSIRVLNDQAAPTLSNASALPVQATYAMNGNQVVLSVTVTLNESMIPIASVVADTAALDSENPEIKLEDPDGDGVYNSIFTISSMGNTNGDGRKVVSFTATDDVKNVSDALTASITLRNDVTAPTLSMASAIPSPAANGTMVYISVSSETDLTVTADASAIGGGMAVALTEGMMTAANGNGNGMTANGNGGNGNGMTANGNGGNGNGMTANGNGMNGMADAAPGNGVYSAMVTVTGAADGEQMIRITATDASGNSSTATASVTVDNTGPMLSMASADPAMATNGTVVTISVSTESGATVMADASAIGGDAAVSLAEGMDADMAGTGMYSAMVTVTDAMDGAQMVSITATDALGNASEAASVSVTVDNTAPALTDAAVTPDWALNGDTVAISVNGGESGLTVTADASDIGGDAALALAEGMDADMAGTGMYSADVTVTDAMGGDQMVSISASDAIGNASEAASATVSIHVVTSASFSPSDVSTGDTVTVSAMGTAGLTATFNVFDAEGTNIVTEGMLTESADAAGSYSGSFDVVIDVHPTGTYWVSVSVGQASMTAEGALTIDHLAQFDLMIGAGTQLIHVPLDVTHIDGVAGTIDTVGDLYDALGDAVNFIISLGADGTWNSYLGDSSAGSVADAAIGDDTGLIAVMSSAATLKLAGNALGTGGVSTISLSAGNNLVGVPLDGDLLSMISDALSPLVSAVVVSNEAGNGFNTIAQAGDPGDGAIMGGVGYIVIAAATASIPVVGVAWDNSGMMDDTGGMVATNGNGASTAPSIGFQTPVLQVQGKLIDQVGMMSLEGLNVSVKNLSSGTVLGHTTATDDYSMTFVKLDTSAAKVGDVLEIKADSPNPLLGVRPVQHVVTAEDVLDSRISLPDLVSYEIPAQTELLANYPNPFNPETWIPFRLAEDASVSLTIYGASGSHVRTIDIGFTPAAVYQGRSEAIYWDGRNNFGEQVSSGIYFYHLNAGDFSATRKMVIVK